MTATASVLPETRGCRPRHEQAAATDHVFTQSYDALRTTYRGLERVAPGAAAADDTAPFWSRRGDVHPHGAVV